jgi:hypothetical protein
MATITEEILRLKSLESKGRGNEKCHVVLVECEAKKRIENKGPHPKTRLIRQLDTPETYSAFNAEFDRFIRESGGNPQIAYSIMLRCLSQLSDADIARLAEEGE